MVMFITFLEQGWRWGLVGYRVTHAGIQGHLERYSRWGNGSLDSIERENVQNKGMNCM